MGKWELQNGTVCYNKKEQGLLQKSTAFSPVYLVKEFELYYKMGQGYYKMGGLLRKYTKHKDWYEMGRGLLQHIGVFRKRLSVLNSLQNRESVITKPERVLWFFY